MSSTPRSITDLAWEQAKAMPFNAPGFIVASFRDRTIREFRDSLPSFHRPQFDGPWCGGERADGSWCVYHPLGESEPPKGWYNLAGTVGTLLCESHESLGITPVTLAIDNSACRFASAVMDLAGSWPQGVYGKPEVCLTRHVENPCTYVVCPGIRKVAEGVLTILDRHVQAMREQADTTVSEREPAEASDGMKPGPDFMTFAWGDEVFEFNRPMQRAAIRRLWEAWQSGHPRIQVERLRELVGSSDNAKPSDWFRGHPAWGKLIVTPMQGVYELQSPA